MTDESLCPSMSSDCFSAPQPSSNPPHLSRNVIPTLIVIILVNEEKTKPSLISRQAPNPCCQAVAIFTSLQKHPSRLFKPKFLVISIYTYIYTLIISERFPYYSINNYQSILTLTVSTIQLFVHFKVK